MAKSVTYEEALSIIHETIGCEDVKRKPELSYKLSDSSQKASPVGLGCDDDWMGLREEVIDRQKKKKTSISVSIIVSEQVRTMPLPWTTWLPLILAYKYMKSLRARSNEGKVAASRGGKAKLGKKMALIDLDDDDDDGQEGDESMMDKEAKFAEQLNKVLIGCQLCGNEKYCHISRTGEHVNLTFQQRRGWAVALV